MQQRCGEAGGLFKDAVELALPGHRHRPLGGDAPLGAAQGGHVQGSTSVSLAMPTADADSTSSLDCATRLSMVFSMAGRPAAPLAMARANGAGMASAELTDKASCALGFSARAGFLAATRSRTPGPSSLEPSRRVYWPSHTFWMPLALFTTSRCVLSEKQECSSSWSCEFSATSMRSPASSPRESEPRPTMILRTDSLPPFSNLAR